MSCYRFSPLLQKKKKKKKINYSCNLINPSTSLIKCTLFIWTKKSSVKVWIAWKRRSFENGRKYSTLASCKKHTKDLEAKKKKKKRRSGQHLIDNEIRRGKSFHSRFLRYLTRGKGEKMAGKSKNELFVIDDLDRRKRMRIQKPRSGGFEILFLIN